LGGYVEFAVNEGLDALVKMVSEFKDVLLEVGGNCPEARLPILFMPCLYLFLDKDMQMSKVFKGLVVSETMQIFGEFGFGGVGAVFKAEVDGASVAVSDGFDLG
jgi:hypothetical protein